MRTASRLIAALALISPPCTALAAQALPSESTIRAMIAAPVDSGFYAGIVVGVVARDGTRRVVAYGPHAGVTPFDGQTVFEIASITKTFAAAVLADMVAKGELALDDPVAKHLPPGTTVPSRNDRQITLLDLATQTSGLPRLPTNFVIHDPTNPYAGYTEADLTAFLASYTLPRDIGSAYEYSNLGFGLLGRALAFRAGVGFETLVRRRILDPLGMSDTRITLTPSMHGRLAPGHTEGGAPTANWDFPTLPAAGALRSTVDDMLTYIHANADSTSAPLGPTLALTHSARRPAGSPAMQIGLAWNRIRTPSGNTIVWHNGETGGYHSFTGYDETTGTGVVVLTNTARSVDEMGMHLLDPLVPLPTLRKAVTLPVETLDQYVGTYQIQPGAVFTITRNGTQVMAQITGQPANPIYASGTDQFFYTVVDATISFERDAGGTVTGLVLHQGALTVPAKRR